MRVSETAGSSLGLRPSSESHAFLLCGALRPMVKEAAAILITAQGANFGAAEKAVTVAGYDVVSRVAEDFGQELQEECGGSPEAWELLQDEEDGAGAGE